MLSHNIVLKREFLYNGNYIDLLAASVSKISD